MKDEDLLPGVEMATRESRFAHIHANTVVFYLLTPSQERVLQTRDKFPPSEGNVHDTH